MGNSIEAIDAQHRGKDSAVAKLIHLTDVGAADERAAVMRELESVHFERQPGFNAATPRRRAVLHSDTIATFLFNAVQPHLGRVTDWPVSDALRCRIRPPQTWRFAGVDPFIRLYRYQRGESFRIHQDEERPLTQTLHTALTILLYLPGDDTLVGGETFVDDQAIVPVPWSIAAFAHDSWHHGAEIMHGTKTVLRGDVTITSES